MKLHKKLLICASCQKELSGILKEEKFSIGKVFELNQATDILISGVGTWLSVYNLTKLFSERSYDLAIFVGICGVYNENEELLQLYSVKKTTFSDCGFETPEGDFVSVIGTEFLDKNSFGFSDGYFHNDIVFSGLTPTICNTVSRCITKKEYVKKMLEKFPAEIETMESAAFAMVCINEKQKFLEIRCGSNYVAPKKEKKWQVKPAIEKLNYFLSSKILDSASKILS